MYGAFWCSHCYDQKQTLGAEAMRSIPYIECAKDGANSQRKLCQEKEIPGYPTWEINGKLHPGEQVGVARSFASFLCLVPRHAAAATTTIITFHSQTLDDLEDLVGIKAEALTPPTAELSLEANKGMGF